ncbi:MAG: UDP-N-acetylmuramoyl-tripeptide--D-alanyl-D-alanine ligase [Firmicutes bacterium]|nr:UDP-N-acetylmuramoyl-tripeptide--D-alanyl-D-alanine ligase [Bacillota bacterium]
MSLLVDEVLKATGGVLLTGGKKTFRGVLIDSRETKGGELFIPLKGERTDGHNFILNALENGAAGSLVEQRQLSLLQGSGFPPGKTLVAVDDTLQALHKLAFFYRQKYMIPLIAVTGSNGKTTTKDFVASVLATRYNVLKTEGNFNNHLGVPLTLLRLEKEHDVAVLEMGMSGLGEISKLASLAVPSMGIITNIGEAHLEHLGSVENICKAKNELLDALGAGKTAFLNGDDPYLLRMGKNFAGQTFYFGFGEGANLRALNYFSSGNGLRFTVEMPEMKRQEFEIPVPGKHNVYNALAAIAVGMHFQIESENIKKGLAEAKISGMRMERKTARGGFQVINDAYNASPSSMKAALQTLKDLAGSSRVIAVLGDMLELGDIAEEGHLSVGRYAADLPVDYLITVGELAVLIARGAREAGLPERKIFAVKNPRLALEHLQSLELKGSVVLVKGSRMMRLEQITEGLLADSESVQGTGT